MSETISLFIGLGPNGDVTEGELQAHFAEIAPPGEVRMRGSIAFVDARNAADADKYISQLNGTYINSSRLFVKLDQKEDFKPRTETEGTSVFIGLGPNGDAVSEEDIRAACGDVAPFKGFNRKNPGLAFIDTDNAGDAQKFVEKLNGVTINSVRLSVNISRGRGGGGGGGRGGRGGDRGGRGGRGGHGFGGGYGDQGGRGGRANYY